MLCALAASVAAQQNELARTFVNVALPTLDSSDREIIGDLLTGDCDTENDASKFLNKVVNATQVCIDTNSIDRNHFDKCLVETEALIDRHFGLDLLATTHLTTAAKTTISQCARGKHLPDAMVTILTRFTPCNGVVTDKERDVFVKVLADETEYAMNRFALQNICLNLQLYADSSNYVTDFIKGVRARVRQLPADAPLSGAFFPQRWVGERWRRRGVQGVAGGRHRFVLVGRRAAPPPHVRGRERARRGLPPGARPQPQHEARGARQLLMHHIGHGELQHVDHGAKGAEYWLASTDTGGLTNSRTPLDEGGIANVLDVADPRTAPRSASTRRGSGCRGGAPSGATSSRGSASG